MPFFQIRYFAPLALILSLVSYFCINDVQNYSQKRFVFSTLTDEELIQNDYLNANVNGRPIVGHSNLYYVMNRKNPKIIDHFLSKGADVEKVMYYLSLIDDPKLTAHYLLVLSDKISEGTIEKALSSLKGHQNSEEMMVSLSASPKFQKWLKAEKKVERLPASTTSTQPDNQQ